jgi:hypothetical protein
MLWGSLAYKAWLETRLRLLMTLGVMGSFMVFFYSIGAKVPVAPDGKSFLFGYLGFNVPCMVAFTCAWLAGAGVVTQPAFQATKGLHGSTMFTLALPVSRFRLLAVRAGLGWLQVTGAVGAQCIGMWIVFPSLRATVMAAEMFEYSGALLACASMVYFLSVLLATFLDDLWRMWGTLIGCGLLWWLPSHTHLPVSADIFRAIGEGSPLIAHTMPWGAMAVSLTLTAALFFGALKVVQLREY